MKVWTRLEGFQQSPEGLLLALGNFDGVHVGHQKILTTVVDRARRQKGIPAVLTFLEHPQRVLHDSKTPASLTSPQHRLLLFTDMGIEVCFLLHFTLTLSRMKAENFVSDILVRTLGVREIHLGHNAHFGLDRKGDSSLMRELSPKLGFDFHETIPVKVNEQFVSSTLIRQAIRGGDLDRARVLLGRQFSIFASVVRGRGKGRQLGYPTANLRPHSEILPPGGVYAVEVRESLYHMKSIREGYEYEFVAEVPERWHRGVLNFGSRPTFDGSVGDLVPEVFLLDFSGDLYGKTLEVVFHAKLREERKFQSSDELAKAIHHDVESVERYFRSVAK